MGLYTHAYMTEASSHFLDKIIGLTRQFASISCFKGETMRTKGVIFYRSGSLPVTKTTVSKRLRKLTPSQ